MALPACLLAVVFTSLSKVSVLCVLDSYELLSQKKNWVKNN